MTTTSKKINTVLLPSIILLLTITLSCTNGNDNGDDNGSEQIPIIKPAYNYFVDISAIPRCSGNEQSISNRLIAFGKSLNLYTRQDTALNVLIRKPGSKGREHEPYVVLQAHTDIVCRKDDDVEHDFETDPIVPVITNDGWVAASKRTTLGADNGCGVSIIMAVLASTFSHPPIEALFTADEETGLTGAGKFDLSWLDGRRLVNLDLTAEGMIVSSSTREDDGIFIPMVTEPAALAKVRNYPDWHYRENSPLRDIMVETFKEMYGYPPVFAAINVNRAAVECVAFADRMQDLGIDLDMAAIGADIEDIHQPGERMNLASYERLYEYVINLLGKL